jgi:hypothetical protein
MHSPIGESLTGVKRAGAVWRAKNEAGEGLVPD